MNLIQVEMKREQMVNFSEHCNLQFVASLTVSYGCFASVDIRVVMIERSCRCLNSSGIKGLILSHRRLHM